MKQLVLMLLKMYQMTRFLRRPSCRFYPSCSNYSYHAIANHGLIKGFYLVAKRLLCCHPFHPGGVDEVPNYRTSQRI